MLVAIGLLLGFSLTLIGHTLGLARSHDFLGEYTGGYLLLHGRGGFLYDPAVQFSAQRDLGSANLQVIPFIRPPFYAAGMALLSWISLDAASWIWAALNTAVFLGCLAWAYRRFGLNAVLVGVLSFWISLGIAEGQDCAILLALLIAAYGLALRSSWFAAGAVLGLLLAKFHLILLWPIALLLQRRWRMLAGFAAIAAIELAVSLAAVGESGLRSYLGLLLRDDVPNVSPKPETMVGFTGIAANLGVTSLASKSAIVVLVLLLFLFALRRRSVDQLFAAAATASVLVAPHAYGYDMSLLLLVCWLAIFRSKAVPLRVAGIIVATPLPGIALLVFRRPWPIVAPGLLLLLLAMLMAYPLAPVKMLENQVPSADEGGESACPAAGIP